MRCTTKCFNQRERHQCPNQNGPLRRALNCAHRAILWARRSAGWDEPSLNCGGPSPPLNGRPAARNAASPSLSYNRKEPWVAQAAFSPCKTYWFIVYVRCRAEELAKSNRRSSDSCGVLPGDRHFSKPCQPAREGFDPRLARQRDCSSRLPVPGARRRHVN